MPLFPFRLTCKVVLFFLWIFLSTTLLFFLLVLISVVSFDSSRIKIKILISRIDEIQSVRGELPLEVKYLEDDIAGVQLRVEKVNAEIHDLNAQITDKKNVIELAKGLIEKYKSQQDNVRNNREYDDLSKEIEF